MVEVTLHGALWRGAEEARREEWRRMIEEINADNEVDPRAPGEFSLELVRLPGGSFQWRLNRDFFERVDAVVLDEARLDVLFEDYASTIRQMVRMDRDAPARGFESMDYAKRVVHDEAADYLLGALQPMVSLRAEDARRLFTLIFLVGGDLPAELVRYHRAH